MNRFALAFGLALIAAPALAAPLAFSDAPGPAINIARTLMGEEQGGPLPDDTKVSVAILDVDGDGTDEIFAFAQAPFFCGAAGCVPRLYRLDTSTMHWNTLPITADQPINGDASMWSIGAADSSGWMQLIFSPPGASRSFGWTGSSYAPLP